MMQYIWKNNILSQNQYGFRSKDSTCSQLLFCTNIWTMNADSKKPTDVIYFDFEKAFDTVCHEKLFLKLKSIGIKEF